MLNKTQGERITEAILRAISTISADQIRTASYSQTTRGKITAITNNNTYTVMISNKEYTNISSLDGKTYQINDIVWCHIPNNQWTLMFIMGKIS